ncbi:hypothetical protein LSAT2_000518 [Lamellibrachia satsuma]|nr:hypothetical protein LSAT2_000518 [Lamellibrachia satsuma]
MEKNDHEEADSRICLRVHNTLKELHRVLKATSGLQLVLDGVQSGQHYQLLLLAVGIMPQLDFLLVDIFCELIDRCALTLVFVCFECFLLNYRQQETNSYIDKRSATATSAAAVHV